jgi:hypothetical protein
MRTLEVTDVEADVIRRLRLPRAERLAEQQVRAAANRQAVLDRMTPEERAAYDAEVARRASLTDEQRKVEALVSQRARLARDQAAVDAELGKEPSLLPLIETREAELVAEKIAIDQARRKNRVVEG